MKLKVLQLPSHFTPTHQTSGLPGFPAVDLFAPAGSPVASPCNGTVIKLSGHPPTSHAEPGGPYGWSIYIRDLEGVYYLTHFEDRSSRAVVGATVRRGQYLGHVADYSHATSGVTPSHIHEGFHLGAWSP